MLIRKFQPNDLDEVLQLFYDVVHTVGAKYYNQNQVDAWAPSNGVDKERWLSSLMSNYSYVAVVKDKIIGFGDMTPEGYIDRLYVHKNYQGSGAALKLFRKMEEDARTLGLPELTGEASIILKPLAEKYGFEVIEEQMKVHRGITFITYKMRKCLKEKN